MKVTLIQTELHWEDRQKNLAHFDTLINSIQDATDLIVLPEMFTTGFSMNPQKVAEKHEGEGLAWMKKKANEKNATLVGSIAVEENGKYFNRLYWVESTGNYKSYDKRHLFRMAKEDEFYTAGTKKTIGHIKEWKVCPLVCYDLRFPVWSRNRFRLADGSEQDSVDTDAERSRSGRKQEADGSWDYDVLIYVANWPEVRNYPWKHLLISRAIENQCYVIGLNRIGNDGNGFGHSGDSVVLNPRGEVISQTRANEESVETISLDRTYLDTFRKAFPVGLDSDPFTF